MSFAEDLHRWQGFFTLLGEATASFAGLLFVALALNRAEIRDPARSHQLFLARQTFFNLLALTALSLLALIPPSENFAQSYAGSVVATCVSGIATCLLAIREERRARIGRAPSRESVRAYYGPVLVYASLLAPSVETCIRGTNNLVFIAAGLLALVLASARNAWLLLFLP